MNIIFKKIDALVTWANNTTTKIATPLIELALRYYVGMIFFNSGVIKFNRWMNDNHDTTVFIFEELKMPFGADPSMMAFGAMIGELILPVLFILGLGGRVAAAGLLVMTAVIEYSAGHNSQHVLWAGVAMMVLLRGAGKISLDHLLPKLAGRG